MSNYFHIQFLSKFTIGLALFIFISACRKDVTLDLPNYEQKVVIEASIETGAPALVFLSNSVPYFGEFDFTSPQTAFIKGAKITVSDGTNSEVLIEADPTVGYIYFGTQLIGQMGKTYTVSVQVNGKIFETTSTILSPPKLDSVYFKAERDSLGYIYQQFSEPAGSGDCYRWFSKRLGRDLFFAAPFNSVFDDKFIDGASFEFAYDRGQQPNRGQEIPSDRERGFYKRGDTVVIKFCKIGRREYDFWYTYYQNRLSNGNPFSSPANVRSMFENYRECFGSFVAYSPGYDTLIIP